MGNIIARDGSLYHDIGNGQHEELAVDEQGAHLIGILQGDGVSVLRDAHRVVISVGGTHISVLPAVGVALAAALGETLPDAAMIEADQIIGAQERRIETALAQRKQAASAELADAMADQQAELDRLTEAVEAKRAELKGHDEDAGISGP